MAFFDKFPYTNFQELNLDWIISKVKDITIFRDEAKQAAEDAASSADLASDSATAAHDSADDAAASAAEAAQYAVINNQRGVYTDFAALQAGRFLCIGDSYAGGYNSDDGYSTLANGWAKQMQSRLGIADADFFIYHDGGCGFSNPGGTYRWSDQINQYASQVTNPDTITHVIFGGGYNDYNQTDADIRNYMKQAADNARALYPNARIYVAFFGENGSSLSIHRNLQTKRADYLNFAGYAGMTYIKPCDMALIRQNQMSGDLIHPNTLGNARIAETMIQGLLGIEDMQFHGSATITPETGVTMNTGSGLHTDGNIITLILNPQTIAVTSTLQTFNELFIPLFKTDVMKMRSPQIRVGKEVKFVMKYNDGSTKYRNTSGYFVSIDDIFGILLNETNSAENNFQSGTVENFALPSISISMDAYIGDMMY